MGICPNRLFFILCLMGLTITTACHSQPEMKRYAMTGAVVAIHPDTGTLTVHNDDVPGFMPPMNMDYKITNPKTMEHIKSGDKIKAMLVIEGHNPAQLEDVAVLGK